MDMFKLYPSLRCMILLLLYDDIVLFALIGVKAAQDFLLKMYFLKKNIVHLAVMSDNIKTGVMKHEG